MASPEKVTFSISTESLLRILLVAIGAWFLWVIHSIIALIFVCLILSSALTPTVEYLQRYRIPRILSVILIYVVFLTLITTVIAGIAGPIATEVKNLAQQLPRYYDEVNASIENLQNSSSIPFLTPSRLQNLSGGLDSMITNLTSLASGNAFTVVSAVFGGVISVVLALVITFYFIIQHGAVRYFIMWVVPRGREEETIAIIEKIQTKLGLWLRGQLLLSLIIFLLDYVGLKILGVQYALVLALLAGVLEVVPYLGPILSAIPAVFLTLATSGWFLAVLVLALYTLVQQLENHIILPKVMAKSVGLNPLVVIVAVLIGAKLSGVVGALMAVPVATAIAVYLEEKGYKKELIV